MAVALPLGIIAQLMLAQQANRASESHLHAEPDQQVFKPFWARKAVVNQLAMATQRMPEQQYKGCSGREQNHRR